MGRMHKVSGILGAIGLCAGISIGSEGSNSLNCTKLTESLCAELEEISSDTIKIPVSISLPWPELDSVCRSGGVPRPDTNGICRYNFEDSAYVEMLTEAKEDVFNTYELWDGDNPSQRLQASIATDIVYHNVLATKATIIRLSGEEYVTTIEKFRKYGPLGTRSSKLRHNSIKAGNGETFLINGQKQGKNPAKTHIVIRPW